jgi:hypothetical protein
MAGEGKVLAGIGALAGMGALTYVLGRNASARPPGEFQPPLVTGEFKVGTYLAIKGCKDSPILKITEIIGDPEEAVKPRKAGCFKIVYVDPGNTGLPVGTVRYLGIEEAYLYYDKIKEK